MVFGPGTGRVEHDWFFGLGTHAKMIMSGANGGILVHSRKAKRGF
jgi:hypothetical protein